MFKYKMYPMPDIVKDKMNVFNNWSQPYLDRSLPGRAEPRVALFQGPPV
jgi:hypothetical protein